MLGLCQKCIEPENQQQQAKPVETYSRPTHELPSSLPTPKFAAKKPTALLNSPICLIENVKGKVEMTCVEPVQDFDADAAGFITLKRNIRLSRKLI